MARGWFKDVLRRHGQPVQNARVYIYETGTTTAADGVYDARSGGTEITTVVTNNQGEVEFWVDAPRTLDLLYTDNSDAAYYASRPAAIVTFDSFTETVDIATATGDYLTEAEHDALTHDAVPTDHGVLSGLGDDDHPHYLNEARGDARYLSLGTAAADPTLYVSTTGDDGNDGLSPGEAKATIAAAITALPAGGGIVQCGIGDFAGGFTTGTKKVIVRGVGQEITWITGTGVTIVTLASGGSRLEHIGVRDATGHADTIGVLVDNGASGVDRWGLDSVFIWGTGKLGVGLKTIFGLKGTVRDSEIIAWTTGVYLDREGVGSNQSNANHFSGAKVRGNTTGVHFPSDGSLNTSWNGCTLEANEVGALVEYGFHSFSGCHFENGVGATPTNWKGVGYVRTNNCFFQDATYDIWVTGGASRHLSAGDFFAAQVRHDGTGTFRILTPAQGSPTISGTGSASVQVTDP